MKSEVFKDLDVLTFATAEYIRRESARHTSDVFLTSSMHHSPAGEVYIFELQLPALNNEDDYAPCFQVSIELEAPVYKVEMDIIKGYGPIYEADSFQFREEGYEKEVLKERIRLMADKFVKIFVENYLSQI